MIDCARARACVCEMIKYICVRDLSYIIKLYLASDLDANLLPLGSGYVLDFCV